MRLFSLSILAVLICASAFGQDRSKAQQAVSTYLQTVGKSYVPLAFGECFVQTYPGEVQSVMGGTGSVKYSLVHTYTLDGVRHVDEYFHLDANYSVLGQLSMQQMSDITTRILLSNPGFIKVMDSIGRGTNAIEKR